MATPNRKPESTFIKTETRDNCAAAKNASKTQTKKMKRQWQKAKKMRSKQSKKRELGGEGRSLGHNFSLALLANGKQCPWGDVDELISCTNKAIFRMPRLPKLYSLPFVSSRHQNDQRQQRRPLNCNFQDLSVNNKCHIICK